MNQITQPFKNRLATYWVLQLLSIVFMLNVVQCKCNPAAEDPELSLGVKEDNLVGNNKNTEATLTNSKAGTTADLSRYGLLAEITEGKGKVKCGTTELTIGTAQPLKELLGSDELGEESKNFDLTVEPDAGVGKFEVKLSVIELDNSTEPLANQTITWTDGWSAAIVGLKDFAGTIGATADFEVENDGEIDWNTDHIDVEVVSSTDASFELGTIATSGAGTVAKNTLTKALGASASDIAKKAKTGQLTLKLKDGKGQNSADITIKLIRSSDGTVLDTKTITWTDGWSVAIVGLKDFAGTIGTAEVKFKVKNNGAIDWNTDHIDVEVEVSNIVEFELGNLTLTPNPFRKNTSLEGTLASALGASTNNITSGTETGDLTLKLKNDKGQSSAQITITLIRSSDGTVLDTKTIAWTDGRSAQIVGLKDFEGTVGATADFEVENNGAIDWNTDHIDVEITSSTAAEFELGNLAISGPATTGTLTEALGAGASASNIAKGAKAGKLTLELKNDNGQSSAQITIKLIRKSDNKELAKQTIAWTNRDIQLSIDNSNSILSVIGNDPAIIEIKNDDSDPTADGEAVLAIKRTSGDADLDYTNIKGSGYHNTKGTPAGDNVEIELKAINKGTNQIVEIPIAAKTEPTAKFEVSLQYRGKQVGAKGKIDWKDKDVQLSIDNSNSILNVTGNNPATIEIKNDGNHPTEDGEVVLVITRVTRVGGDAELDHANIGGSGYLQIGGKSTGSNVEVALKAINKGAVTVDIPITAKNKPTAKFEVSLMYRSKPVGAKEKIDWKDKDVQLSIDNSNSILNVTGNNPATIEIKNDGNHPTEDGEVVLVITRVTKAGGDADLDHANIKGSGYHNTKTATVDKVEIELTAITKGTNQKVDIPITAKTEPTVKFKVSLMYKGSLCKSSTNINWSK